jgi:proteic killer suppression protein
MKEKIHSNYPKIAENSLLTLNALRYTLRIMIQSFKCMETEKIFKREFSKKLPRDIQRIAFRKLRMLSRSVSLSDMRVPPANRLQKLHGERADQLSIRINGQYRICFRWHNNDAYGVEIVDYH